MNKYLLLHSFCLTLLSLIAHSQPFTKKYILCLHSCNATCTGFQDHLSQLVESDDGTNWTVVPNFIPYKGSVPDVITRNNTLYLYNPGKVTRYNNLTNTWLPAANVSIKDNNNNSVQFVDPSAIIDSNGNMVLFFLNATGTPIGQDPASCPSYPCTKIFDSAVEIPGSDGTLFTLEPNHRLTLTLQGGTASDPDIFFDSTTYILYISAGTNTLAYKSTTLQGTYSSFPNLNNNVLTNQGGIPCGIFDAANNKYYTYVHTNIGGNTVIRQAIHNNFSTSLNNFTTVVSAATFAEPQSTTSESPGICLNTFLSNCPFYPTITGLKAICSGNLSTYTVPLGPPGAIYNWLITNGTISNSPPYTNTINVLWNNSGVGTLQIEQINP